MRYPKPFIYIDQQRQMDLALKHLREMPCLAVDTESSGYYTYFSEICLIQISAGRFHYIIDTLSSLELGGLGELFARKEVTKIFHAAASDIGELKRCYGWRFHNIFDTFLACRMLGHRSCSLSSLVLEYEGVRLEKREQKSNWKKRPLTDSQLWYAHLDTVYLEDLRSKLEQALQGASFWEEITEEFERIANGSASSASEKKFDENLWLKIPGAWHLPPLQKGSLKKLYLLRDQRGRRDNIAVFRLANNENLLHLAKADPPPRNVAAIAALRLISPSFLKKDGQLILKALQNREEIHDARIARTGSSYRQDAGALAAMRKLKSWRQQVAHSRMIDPSMVLNNRSLEQIAESRPASLEDLQRLGVMTNWKLKKYGGQILTVLESSPKAGAS